MWRVPVNEINRRRKGLQAAIPSQRGRRDCGGGFCPRPQSPQRSTMTTEVSDDDFEEILGQTRHFVRTAVVAREQEILAGPDARRSARAGREDGTVRLRDPAGVGRPRTEPRPGCRAGDGVGLHIARAAVDVRHQQRHRRSGARGVRHRRTEGPLARADGHRSGGLVRADRTGRGIESIGPAHEGRSRGADWIINGQKRFITNAPVADLFIVFARTRPADENGAGHRRLPGTRRHGRRSRSASRTPRWARKARGRQTTASATSACRTEH